MESSMIYLWATESQNVWNLDSGCSKHMTSDSRKFITLKDNKGKVTFGDSLSSKIIGKGTTVVNNKIKVENVLLVENLKPNLLSVSQTCDQGHICIFDSEKCEIRKDRWHCYEKYKQCIHLGKWKSKLLKYGRWKLVME